MHIEREYGDGRVELWQAGSGESALLNNTQTDSPEGQLVGEQFSTVQ